MLAAVDQRRAANARRITRMGGAVSTNLEQASEPAIDERRVIRDAAGQIVRIL